MRFMIMVKASKDSEAGIWPEGIDEVFTAMADYHEALGKAGVLLDGAGLHPSAEGWRIRYSGGKRTVIDGPFAETKELVAGYTLIQTKTREEAIEWARRFPNPGVTDGEIEVRQLYDLDELPQGEANDRFREMGMGGQK